MNQRHFLSVTYIYIYTSSRQTAIGDEQTVTKNTQAEPGAYLLRDSSRVPRRRPFIYLKPPYAIGSVPSFKKNQNAPRPSEQPPVREGEMSKRFYRVTQLRTDGVYYRESVGTGPKNPEVVSYERVMPWQFPMDQLIIYASLSHTHYWYEVGMLKVV